VHAFLEGTTCRDLVRELGRSLPVDSNELFDIATSFASGEEAVGAIFDGKKGKRVDDAPAEGSKSKDPQLKHKRGRKGKKSRREACEQGRDDDGDEALWWGQYPLVVDPVIGNARFSKVLTDGGSSLNILYVHTLRLLGIGLDQLRPSTMPFHGVASGKRV
jgi:hypothetical protein